MSDGLRYVANYIFRERFALNLEISESLSTRRISLSSPNSKESFDFGSPSSIILMETLSLDLEEIDFISSDKSIIFPDESLPLKFDIFSAVFFFLSRYEEYVVDDRDAHGRFCAYHSLQYQWNTLKVPLVDIWILELRSVLKESFPNLDILEERFDSINTFDIDQPFALKGKPFYKVAARMGLDILSLKFGSFRRKLTYFFGGGDPFENWLKYLGQVSNAQIFFLMAGFTKFDKNTQIDSKAFKSLVLGVKGKAKVGLHPSYHSSERNGIAFEKQKLEDICMFNVVESRQHYLRFSLPETPGLLMKSGIQVDYSMGFADSLGFRAGTSRPFSFFDLKKRKSTDLQFVPFSVMDVTLRNYLGLTPAEAMDSIKTLIDEIKGSNGLFVSLWHNESLSEIDGWDGWLKVHEEMLNYQKDQF